jgi:EAL domain-containing protein (putative c-di-GMP-specific phosphodiesterase class I)
MHEGLDEGQFHLEYQAVVDVWTGEATAAEALARWCHPELGDIRPDEFIPIAEQCGLIVPLGAWVVGRACRDLAGWETSPDFTVCVNVSARQLATPGFDHTVAASLERAEVPSERLCLEITESVLMEDALSTAATLGRLRELGIRIAIDDFGTGYSSLVYLRNFPAQILKIDRRFVAGIAGGLEDLAIVRATIELAHALGLVALAEGVETPEQLTILRTLGCDLAQGFLWSVPVPADDFATMLHDDPALRFELPRTQSVRSVLSLPGETGPVLN